MNEEELVKLADILVVKMALNCKAPTKIIWTRKDCATYLRVSERHFVDRISKDWGFPTPIKLPSETKKGGQGRWFAHEVEEWVAKHKRVS